MRRYHMHSATIISKTKKNEPIEITLTQMGDDEGIFLTRTARKRDKIDVYNIRVAADYSKIVFNATVMGPDPDVQCILNADQSITMTIEGAMAGNGVNVYKLNAEDFEEIKSFIVNSNFPKI